MDKSTIVPLMNNSALSEDYTAHSNLHSKYEGREVKSKLVEMDKMLDRYHSPHLLSLGFIVSKNESPNANRFLNINKSPLVLSTIERVRSPSLEGYSPRKDSDPLPVCASICYDTNMDAVRPKPAKTVLNFDKTTGR